MLQKLTVMITALLFLLTAYSGTVLAQQSTAEQTAQLDELFSAWDSEETPGCAVGVSADGSPVISRAWGMADLEHMIPNSPSTIFEAGSVSKQFVTAAVILLHLDGKLNIEDDVREYVPELPDYGYIITLRHLMNHTAGLRDWGAVTSISGWGRSERTHNHDHVLDILSRQTRLNFQPGERYSYSNSGYNLLAIVVERAAGMPFAEFTDEKLFGPLGMTSTQWRDDYTRIVPGRSSAYTGSEGSENFSINRPIEHVHGNGGLLTTVGDLLTWNQAIATKHFGDEFNDQFLKQAVLGSGRTIAYASGVQVSSDHGQPQVVHTGATSGYRAYLSYFPDQNLSVAMLCNVTGANPGRLGSAISKIYLGDDATETERDEPEGVMLNNDQLIARTGIWKDPRNFRPTEIKLDNGVLKVNDGPELIPLSPDRFKIAGSEVEYSFMTPNDAHRPFIRVIREGYEEELLRPVRATDYKALNPEHYTGRFESRDAETVITIREEEGKLVAHRRPSDTFELVPVYEDTFLARGFGLVRFNRTGEGRPASFTYSSGRVYDLRFNRVPGR
jgi:CubicO group peptidase (beta-lactamase class C family)